MGFKNVGQSTLDTVSLGKGGFITMDAAGIASGEAFLVSELEKRDTLVRTPLTSFTYGRDLPIRKAVTEKLQDGAVIRCKLCQCFMEFPDQFIQGA